MREITRFAGRPPAAASRGSGSFGSWQDVEFAGYGARVPVRVLVVDDMPEVRALVRTALRIGGNAEVIGEAGTAESGSTLAAELGPDVVVLDLLLPDAGERDGFCRMVRAAPDSRIVIFSAYEVDREWYESRGARFVGKDPNLTSLVQAVAG
jgi:DNA-binding NarL/FixJ family response regulator